jgi:hypothetical protein
MNQLVAEANFTDLRSGDAPPWLHYVRATKPQRGVTTTNLSSRH